jgi:sensor histidine kinase YesM
MVPFMFLNPRMYGYTTNIFVISLAIAISRGLYIYLNHYSASITRKKDLEISQLKELQLATELNSLHAQINPHFLYNALNSIASLSKIDGNKTEKMALSLSDLFRYSVNRKGEKMSSIQEEVDMVENYLQIEKIRFEDRLEYSIKVDDSLQKLEIPRFILQPLIENAIKHGISKIEEKGFISLEIYLENKKLIVAVSDNGPDFPEGLISGHGLQSVFDLLRLSYGEQASMNWENLPKKKITITITSSFKS